MYLCPARKRLNTLPVGKWCTQDCQPQGRGSHVSVGPERHVASLCSEAFVSPPFFFFPDGEIFPSVSGSVKPTWHWAWAGAQKMWALSLTVWSPEQMRWDSGFFPKKRSQPKPWKLLISQCTYLSHVLSRFSRAWLCATLWTVACSLLCPWDFPGKNTGVGCHFLLQGIFSTQGLKLPLTSLLFHAF